MCSQTVGFLLMIGEFLLSHELRIWLRMAAKPLAVMVTLTVLLALGARFDAQTAHAQTPALACPAGTEQDGALCYPLCQTDYYGEGPVCYKNCPAGYQNDSGLCFKGAHIFAKASYGRGAGVGLVCAPNQEGQGGLCYPRCSPGYYGVGPVCWQSCRAGYADHGAICFKHIFDFYGKPSYGRGAAAAVNACAAGLERNGALCYPPCALGFYGAGPVCFQRCPIGYSDDGATCRKDALVFATPSYGRGVGTVMNSLPVAQDETLRTPKDTPVHLAFPVDNFDNDPLSNIIYVQNPGHGAVEANIYTPEPGFEGADTVQWKVNDGKHDSNVAIATIVVGDVAPNTAPVALDRTVSVSEETPITITVTCTDVDNDELFYQLLKKPQHGAYEWQPPNTVIYTPTVDFVGTDTFTFRSYDGQDVSNVSTITLTVTAINDAPLALAQAFTTTRNNNIGITLFARDVESDTIRYTLVASPTHGLLSGDAPDLLYTPNQNFVGEDS
ncbi:MAG TPA: Ig-like domain-containing protein, partial [Caldilineaceae bacterium]|nr:Ig-like domain-containing protein [Caldilineaceae bacterium]